MEGDSLRCGKLRALSTPPSAADLVRTSLSLGARGLRRAPRQAIWRLWMPLDIDRVHELPWAGRQMVASRATRILDISSPKLLACWLAEHTPAEVVGTDVWVDEIEAWRQLVSGADPSGRRYGRLSLEVADATALPFGDESFDAVFSVSVIEHLPYDADGAMMREIARVLRPGGIAALTFPYRAQYAEEFVSHDLYGQRYTGTPLFFYRHYDEGAVAQRLLGDLDVDVVERGVWTKSGVREASDASRRLLPTGMGLGRAFGPGLIFIGARAMRPGQLTQLATDNVMHLAVRKREGRAS
jgi:SAM-dependent methyltransferase